MKKWSIEWAMKRWGIVKEGPQYRCGIRRIFPAVMHFGKWFKGTNGDYKRYDERDAVRWLVEGQPRVEKKKKWDVVDLQYANQGIQLSGEIAGYLPLKPGEKIIIEPDILTKYRIRKTRKVTE